MCIDMWLDAKYVVLVNITVAIVDAFANLLVAVF